MKVKLIDFGGVAPRREHYNDAGADVFASITDKNCDNYDDLSITIPAHSVRKIPLGIGLDLPSGFVAFVVPRSGMSTNYGITTEMVPIDSGYKGEIHAIVYNASDKPYYVVCGVKIAQLIVMPVIIADFSFGLGKERGTEGFGSSGDNV
jgi:dUTP pyrophosphatase